MDAVCKYCLTPYGDDRDEHGRPLCTCRGAEIERLMRENKELRQRLSLEPRTFTPVEDGFPELVFDGVSSDDVLLRIADHAGDERTVIATYHFIHGWVDPDNQETSIGGKPLAWMELPPYNAERTAGHG